MSNPVNIKILVNTERLVAQLPRGGHITDRTIVVMEDNQSDSYYEDSNNEMYKDKLVSYCDAGDTINWDIKTTDGKNNLVLVDCNESDDFSNMMADQPHKKTDSDDWTAQLKPRIMKGESGFYTYKFAFKSDLNTKWDWDPRLKVRD